MLTLPKRIGKEDVTLEDDKNLVVLGANGSGKTRLSVWIEEQSDKYVHRVAAQKSLAMEKSISPKAKDIAVEEFLYGVTNENKQWLKQEGKKSYRWKSNPDTGLLDDFSRLLVLLHTEEYEVAVNFKDNYEEGIEKPITKLDIIQKIWGKIIAHRKLKKGAGVIEVYQEDKPSELYNAREMSDGERLVFYIIGEVICAPKEAIIIIDEPENHLHYSIINTLWDEIECTRPDCKFIYLTHSIEFATSRINKEVMWIKKYNGNQLWDYELLDENNDIPEVLYYELLGSRRNVLFIEGDEGSLDYLIYNRLFKDYLVKPLQSCSKVIEATEAFNKLSAFHNLRATGIIDRDRRSEEEIRGYNPKNIFAPEVAEIENFFMTEEVIKCICKIRRVEVDEVFKKVKDNIFEKFEQMLDEQCKEISVYQTKEVIRNILQEFEKEKKYDGYINNSLDTIQKFDYNSIYEENKAKLVKCLEEKDYAGVLKYFNFKGMIGVSGILGECEFKNKEKYIEFIKKIIKEETIEGAELREALHKYIQIS